MLDIQIKVCEAIKITRRWHFFAEQIDVVFVVVVVAVVVVVIVVVVFEFDLR